MSRFLALPARLLTFLTPVALGALGALTLGACNRGGSDAHQHQTESGIRYTYHTKGSDGADRRLAKVGDIITTHVSYRNYKDSLLGSTRDRGGSSPITSVVAEPQSRPSVEECIMYLASGDSATFSIPLDSLFKGRADNEWPPYLPKGSDLRVTFAVQRIESPAEISARQTRTAETFMASLPTGAGAAETTPSGLRILRRRVGSGPTAKQGDTVSVSYRGYYPESGATFDQSQPGQPFRLLVGMGMVIPGWDEALLMLPQGTQATLYLPYQIAYGEQGMPGQGPGASGIPPYQPLAFDIEVERVAPAKGTTAAAGKPGSTGPAARGSR